jgi:hypothetical protein
MSKEITVKDKVLREFLKDPTLGSSEMALKINKKYNSVKAAFAKLVEEGFLNRVSRGVYEPNLSEILLDLINRVEALEEQVKKH